MVRGFQLIIIEQSVSLEEEIELKNKLIVRLLSENGNFKRGLKQLLELDFNDVEAKNSFINLLLAES